MPQMLAMGFYEITVDNRAEAVALRHAVYRMWQGNRRQAERSMRLLSCENTSAFSLGLVGAVTVAMAASATISQSISSRGWRRASSILRSLAVRIGWFVWAVWKLRLERADGGAGKKQFHNTLARALLSSMPSKDRSGRPPG